MKKKICFSILLAAILVLCAFALCSCGGEACEHQYTSEVTKEATCDTEGTVRYTCALCADSYTENIRAKGHTYNSVPTAPTCTEDGYTTYTCHCGDSYVNITANALGHTEVIDEAVEPTCTETGLTEGKHCSACGEVLIEQNTVEAFEHDEISHEAKAPTCTEHGWDAYVTCSRCDYTTYAEKAALTHDEISHEAKAPTCTEIGWDTYVTCSRCDYTTYAAIKANGHSHNAVITNPACTAVGYTTYTCHCGDTYVDNYIDALGHTEVIDEAVEPTCTATGLTEGKHCSVCGAVTVVQETVAVKEHKYSTELLHNSTHHYYECECGAKNGEEAHISSGSATSTKDEVCTVCGYVINHAVGIIFKTFEVNGQDVYGEVSNNTTYFSFIGEVIMVGGAKYIVSKTITGTENIPTKTIDLDVGNNTVYIIEMINDEPTAVYTVVLRRKPMYTVTFETNGGTDVKSVQVEEGSVASAPTTERIGYTFVGWDYDFENAVTSNITVSAIWQANTDTKYKVEYYLENVEKNGYEFKESVELCGTTDTTATAEIKSFEHFAYNSYLGSTSGNINGDGSRVLKVYYTRNMYTITASASDTKGGSVTAGGRYPYGSEITLSAMLNVGYTFFGYFIGDDVLCETNDYTFAVSGDINIIAKFEANTNTKYKVEYYLENVEKNGYELKETAELCGTTNTTAYAEIKVLEHFTYNEANSVISGNIDGDGKRVLKVYYTRNVYTIANANKELGQVKSAGDYVYGSEYVETAAFANIGCEFIGWFSNDVFLSDSDTYCFTAEMNVEARFAVKGEMQLFTFTSDRTSCTITGVKDTMQTELIIPDYVTQIEKFALSDCGVLESITLPFVGAQKNGTTDTHFGYIFGADSPTNNSNYVPGSIRTVVITGGDSIGERAFYWCKYLTNITIPNTVTTLGTNAFGGCMALTSFTIPDSVTTIGNSVFSQCLSLTSITIGKGVREIGGNPFTYCDSLTGVYVTDIAAWCNISFVGSYSNPLFIAGNLYLNSELVTELVIPEGTTEIKNYAFYGCTSFTGITISDSVTSIGECAFYNCDGLINVEIPDSVTEIGKSAFYGCDSLISAVIGNGVKIIRSGAFQACSNITSVTIGNGVTNIYSSAFSSVSLEGVYISDLAAWCGIDFGDSETSNPIYRASKLYLNGELITDLVIPDGVTKINTWVFNNCKAIKSVTIPESVTEIEYSAFLGCTNIEILTIPRANHTLGLMFGTRSSEYNSRYVPSTLKTVVVTGGDVICDYAFENCSGIVSISIPNGITKIGDYAFSCCTSLESITIPDSVTSIGQAAFSACSSLESITLPFVGSRKDATSASSSTLFGYIFGTSSSDGSVEIHQYYSLSSYTRYYIPSTLKSVTVTGGNILYGAFYGCHSLTNVTIGNDVTSIGASAFNSCYGLTTVTIGSSVASIDTEAFRLCYRLIEVINHSSLNITAGSTEHGYVGCYAKEVHTGTSKIVNVDGYLFFSANGVNYLLCYLGNDTELTLPENYNGETYEIYESAFENCTELTSINIPNSVTVIGARAFMSCTSLVSIEIPYGVTSIGYNTFRRCTSLKSVVIPDSVTTIGEWVFSSCYSLTSITIPDSITSIGYYTFDYCISLESIIIPYSVTTLGGYEFNGCKNFTIYCEAASQPSGWDSNWNNSSSCPVVWGYNNITTNSEYDYVLHNGKAQLTKYKGSATEVIIPSSIDGYDVEFFGSIFSDIENIVSVVIPDSVTSIGSHAFYNCYNLTSVTIGNGIISIDAYAFKYCYNLTIYCEAESQPSGWDSDWNYSNRPVVWGYKGE